MVESKVAKEAEERYLHDAKFHHKVKGIATLVDAEFLAQNARRLNRDEQNLVALTAALYIHLFDEALKVPHERT